MHGQRIHISSFKFSVFFTRKNLLCLFYTSTFTKYPHQFIYSPHLFNKIFIILQFFIIHSLTAPLSHRPTATTTTIIKNQKPLNQKLISRQANQNSIRTHLISTQNQRKINVRSTNTNQPTQRKINADQNAIVSMPPCLHTYPNQPTTQINPDQANPHKPRPTHTINSN